MFLVSLCSVMRNLHHPLVRGTSCHSCRHETSWQELHERPGIESILGKLLWLGFGVLFFVTNVKFLSNLLKALICFKGTITDWCVPVWVRQVIDDDCWVLLWDLGSVKSDTCKIHHWIQPGKPKQEGKKSTLKCLKNTGPVHVSPAKYSSGISEWGKFTIKKVVRLKLKRWGVACWTHFPCTTVHAKHLRTAMPIQTNGPPSQISHLQHWP